MVLRFDICATYVCGLIVTPHRNCITRSHPRLAQMHQNVRWASSFAYTIIACDKRFVEYSYLLSSGLFLLMILTYCCLYCVPNTWNRAVVLEKTVHNALDALL